MDLAPCDVLSPEVYAQNRCWSCSRRSFIGGAAVMAEFLCILANLSTKLNFKICLAPEHPFPSAIEDIFAVYALLQNRQGYSCRRRLRCCNRPIISRCPENIRSCLKNIILFSPWLDFSPESPLFGLKKASDEVISADCIKRCADLYTYRSNLQNPSVSPMCASESALGLLPPVFIQMGEKEILLPEAKRFINRLYHAGADYELDVWENMMHLFQMADEFLPEAHKAVEKAGNRIKKLQ